MGPRSKNRQKKLRGTQGLVKEVDKRLVDTQHQISDMQKLVAETVEQQVVDIRKMVAEAAKGDTALLEAVNRSGERQEGMRAAVVREIDQLRELISTELRFQILRNACREIIPVLQAIKRMVSGADFSDAAVIRQHVESFASTLDGVLGRLGIEQLDVQVGVSLFDHNLHDCVRVCDSSDSPLPDAPNRTIVRVEEPGYSIGGQLAVPARVWVQKNEDEKTSQEKGQ